MEVSPLALVLCMCASPSSGIRQIHDESSQAVFWGRRINEKWSRYDPEDKDKLNAIIDQCGDENNNQCIRKKCEAMWPEKKHWEVINTKTDDQDEHFGFNAIKKMFLKFRYRVMFKHSLDTAVLFIAADPIPRR